MLRGGKRSKDIKPTISRRDRTQERVRRLTPRESEGTDPRSMDEIEPNTGRRDEPKKERDQT